MDYTYEANLPRNWEHLDTGIDDEEINEEEDAE